MTDVRAEFKEVDLSSPALATGETYKVDVGGAEEAFGFGEPPHGILDLKLGLSTNRAVEFDGKDYRFNLQMEVTTEGDFEGTYVFGMCSTKVGRGKSISTVGALIAKAGYGDKLKPEMSALDMARMFQAVLKREPIIKGNVIEWRGSYKWVKTLSKPNAEGKTEEDRYENVFRAYDAFPKEPDGSRRFEVSTKDPNGNPVLVKAQPFVHTWGDVKGGTAKTKSSVVDTFDITSPTTAPVPTITTAATANGNTPVTNAEIEFDLDHA